MLLETSLKNLVKTFWYYVQFLLVPSVFVVAVVQGFVQAIYVTIGIVKDHIDSRRD